MTNPNQFGENGDNNNGFGGGFGSDYTPNHSADSAADSSADSSSNQGFGWGGQSGFGSPSQDSGFGLSLIHI